MTNRAVLFPAFINFVSGFTPKAVADDLGLSRFAAYRLHKQFISGELLESLRKLRIPLPKEQWDSLTRQEQIRLILSSR
jgi:hypothetical protein